MTDSGLRQNKKIRVKRELYLAAMELFRQKGFDETSVEEIAEQAGYSRATFFNHFGSKQGVLRFYGQRLQERVEELLDASEDSVSPLEMIRRMITAMVREAEENSEEVRIICTKSMLDPEYLSNPTPARKRLFELLVGLVRKAQQEGFIRRDIAADELAMHMFFLYQGVVIAVVTGQGHSESLLRSVWSFILEGVRHGTDADR